MQKIKIKSLKFKNNNEYLIKKSSAYIGVVSTNDEVQALLDEITQLRQDNLELQQTILTLQTPS
jgi:superfamily I DNA and RNA helicase